MVTFKICNFAQAFEREQKQKMHHHQLTESFCVSVGPNVINPALDIKPFTTEEVNGP